MGGHGGADAGVGREPGEESGGAGGLRQVGQREDRVEGVGCVVVGLPGGGAVAGCRGGFEGRVGGVGAGADGAVARWDGGVQGGDF